MLNQLQSTLPKCKLKLRSSQYLLLTMLCLLTSLDQYQHCQMRTAQDSRKFALTFLINTMLRTVCSCILASFVSYLIQSLVPALFRKCITKFLLLIQELLRRISSYPKSTTRKVQKPPTRDMLEIVFNLMKQAMRLHSKQLRKVEVDLLQVD